MKITTITLNPCIDWLYQVPRLVHGGLNRVVRTRADIAGKAINVAVALKNLGESPLCTGFNFTENGALLTSKLNALGVQHDFVEAEGAIRVNIKLYEGAVSTVSSTPHADHTGVMTELNQSGAFVPEAAQAALLQKLEATQSGYFVLSGSRPEGVDEGFYAKICDVCNGRVFLDTEGNALKSALTASRQRNNVSASTETAARGIFGLKPNLFELETTFGVKLKTPREIADFCKTRLIEPFGVKIVCVSMGADGAVFVTAENAFFCPVLDITPKGVVGAGDSMVAGMVYACARNMPDDKIFAYAMAAAAASVVLEGTEMCTKQGVEDMLRVVPLFVPL
ncbi:MAG: hexose kinase [Defluviitaleaceae bacterium]|nr:hexose kinase [Defluviitaleaceae bacterium]